MSTLTKGKIFELLWEQPILIGRWAGFKDLTDLHNNWLRSFLYSDQDQTLQAHRGSYKTTVIALFLAIHAIERPHESAMYFRKTDSDVQEVAKLVANILQSGAVRQIVRCIYGRDLTITRETHSQIDTNISTNTSGVSQIRGLGIGTSITGKHADIVITDDIVNVKDRASRAERERTKAAFMELQNVKNRGGRFINCGTPWHKEDAFMLMTNIAKYDYKATGMISYEEVQRLKAGMSPSLFAANYELRHIPSEDVIFTDPDTGAPPEHCMNGDMHVDSAFYGDDYTALTVMAKRNGKYYMYGRLWRKHVEDCYADIVQIYNHFLCKAVHMENNADKGMVAKELRQLGVRVKPYTEHTNKYIKIVTYLKSIWPDAVFVDGTDEEYINQICDYTENAEHDDAPDSAASIARQLQKTIKVKTFGGGI